MRNTAVAVRFDASELATMLAVIAKALVARGTVGSKAGPDKIMASAAPMA